MAVDRAVVFQGFKYTVYALLALNVYLFGREEYLAAELQFADGIALNQLIEAYAATIDTAAWVVLLLMFELETYVLEDRHFTPRVRRTLHGVRVLSYTIIVYAFYGYVVNVFFAYDVAPMTADLCALATDGWSYAVDLDEYVALTTANCLTLSEAATFFQFGALPAVVDAPGLLDIQRLAWVDAINSIVWILVVILLEVDVRLQEQGRFDGMALRISTALKVFFYSILFLAAVYWGVKGDFVDFWDAFLWLLAFFFIELNVVEWRHETLEAQEASSG